MMKNYTEKNIDCIKHLLKIQTIKDRNKLLREMMRDANKNKENSVVDSIRVNVRSRGDPGDYQNIGSVRSIDNNSIMPLYGRQLGGSIFNYHCETNDHQRMAISVVSGEKNCSDEYGCSELFSGDIIKIPELNSNQYVATIRDNCALRYIPNISGIHNNNKLYN
jgi:E3 ubiquitin-protein ligase DOA10